jgi:hypothetical protein
MNNILALGLPVMDKYIAKLTEPALSVKFNYSLSSECLQAANRIEVMCALALPCRTCSQQPWGSYEFAVYDYPLAWLVSAYTGLFKRLLVR